jgi:Lipid-binding putative hydrolase
MKNKLLILFAFLSIGMMSCDLGNDPDVGGTATQAVAGEWFTTFNVSGETGGDYYLISTSNTAANSTTEFLIFDDANTWDYKVKSPLNLDAKTFGGTGLQNLAYDITVNIANGKILPGAATSSGGNVTDSIYFQIEFSDDPGVIYDVAGYRRTGFLEDEH